MGWVFGPPLDADVDFADRPEAVARQKRGELALQCVWQRSVAIRASEVGGLPLEKRSSRIMVGSQPRGQRPQRQVHLGRRIIRCPARERLDFVGTRNAAQECVRQTERQHGRRHQADQPRQQMGRRLQEQPLEGIQ